MSLAQMSVFNQYVKPLIGETMAQMVDKFNDKSGGAIRLTTEGFDGDFYQESFFASLHAAQRRVDRYSAQGTPAVTDLTQNTANAVKVAGGFGPVRLEPSQLTWLQQPTRAGVEIMSRFFVEALLADQLNTAIACSVAAIENQGAATTIDVSATDPVSYGTMNSAHALFGDASSAIVANVMNGAQFHKLIGQNLVNAEQLFSAGNVQIVGILGRRIIVTDAPALFVAAGEGTPAKNKVLGLAESAAIVFDGADVVTNIDTSNGKTRIETTMQVDYSFGVKLKGYSWDIANGGKSPTDAELATGSNWDKVASSIKHTAGVLAVGEA